MSVRIATAVGLAFLLFAIYSWLTATQVDGFQQAFESASPSAAPIEAPLPRTVSSGGPSTPNQRPAANAGIMMPEEQPFDPMATSEESAALPERLRHPERMFSPGLEPMDTETAVAAGTASMAHMATMNSYQTFGPEFAQNGGVFMEGVLANDSTVPTSYSSV